MTLFRGVLRTILFTFFSVSRTLSLPSIIISSVFDSEVTIVSYALFPKPSSGVANHTQASWIYDVLDDLNNEKLLKTECFMSLAIVGQHTNPSEHPYHICSNKEVKHFKFSPRRIVADASPYLRRDSNFSPIVVIDGRSSDFPCGYFSWTRGVGYIICPLTSTTCSLIDSQPVAMSVYSATTKSDTCRNPISINFTTQAAALRRKVLPPVKLSVCIYSGFRPHEGTRFRGLLEANILYHRKLGVEVIMKK
jgi:hypothetical protein